MQSTRIQTAKEKRSRQSNALYDLNYVNLE